MKLDFRSLMTTIIAIYLLLHFILLFYQTASLSGKDVSSIEMYIPIRL